MTKHPFRIAIESGASPEQLSKLFSPNAELLAPMLTKPLKDPKQIMRVVGHAAKIAAPIEYNVEASDGKQTFLLWKGEIEGFKLEAATILVDGDDGLIRQMRVLMRPWPVSKLFRDAMYKELSNEIPADCWELWEKPAASGSPRKFTPIALKPVEHASNMVLHSPMLAKSVSGQKEVEEAVHLAHQVQSRSSYKSIIATPELLIELFDCDADGYPMEGMWIQKLNADGKINDLTVMLRPYPAVTILRNAVKKLAEIDAGPLAGKDYWELPEPR
jgi:hypothetical protein